MIPDKDGKFQVAQDPLKSNSSLDDCDEKKVGKDFPKITESLSI